MLHCTENAAETLRFVREANGIPATYGFRLYPRSSDDGHRTSLVMGFAEEPADGDVVVENHGERLFVAEALGDSVDNMVLDVDDVPSSAGPPGRELVLRRVSGPRTN